MPQLAVETFPSQIFWILIGFCLVYFFISKVVTPNIEETLQNRAAHVDDLLNAAKQLRSEADQLENDALVALENAELESAAAESELITAYRDRALKEKEELYTLFTEKSKEESASLEESSEKTFKEISENADEILDAALKKVFGTSRNKK